MSLTTILSTATSGLMAAQQGLRTVSDNISNVNTPGYVRKIVDQTSQVTLGAGSGVDVVGIRRVIDRYLQVASVNASALAGKSAISAELYDRVQSLFGDPSNENSFFGRLDQAFSEFSALGNDASSSLQRSDSISSLQTFFDESSRIASSLNALQGETDTRLRGDVEHVNDLLGQIAKLNGDISRAKFSGTDSSGSENIQAQLVNELSGLIDFQTQERTTGGLTLRSADGLLLADAEGAKFSYNTSSGSAGYMTIAPAQGGGTTFEAKLTGGELVGLLQMRDQDIPGAMSQLTEFVAKAAQQINAAHNGYSAAPPPASLTGRNTGLDLPTAVDHFDGKTTLAFMNTAGVIQNQVAIDFDTYSVSVNGGPATNWAPPPAVAPTFLDTMTTALTGIGTIGFANGALSIRANTGGVAIADDPTTPSQKAGMGFSQFFGMNDLVRSSSFAPFETGLTGADPHGFTATDTISLRISDSSGSRLRDVTIAVPAAGSMTALLGALNAPGSGVGGFGQFALDANGRMSFTPSQPNGAAVSVLGDNTSRGAGGPSMSSLFGIGPAERALAASSFKIDPSINQNPALLALAKVNLAAGIQPAVSQGDGSGGVALATAGEKVTGFGAVNNFGATSTTVSRYATEFAGLLGRRAAAAETQQASSDAVKTEAETRRTSYEGVNMDEELVRMTTYQQAFNASARLIQAASDMYDTLLTMTLK